MACRVYRNIRLLDLSTETSELPVSDLHFAREYHTHKYGSGSDPGYSPTSSVEDRSRLGSTILSSGTLDTNSIAKPRPACAEQPAGLTVFESSNVEISPKANQ